MSSQVERFGSNSISHVVPTRKLEWQHEVYHNPVVTDLAVLRAQAIARGSARTAFQGKVETTRIHHHGVKETCDGQRHEEYGKVGI